MDLTNTPDRRLADWLFYDDVRIARELELDGLQCPDLDEPGHDTARCGACSELDAAAAERAEVKAEIARREAAGIRVDDPEAPTFEERFEPFGLEWQIEQRERGVIG
jgi:hypothetical protein